VFSTLTIRQRVGHVLVALVALAYTVLGGVLLPLLEFRSAGFLGWAAAVWLCQIGAMRQLKGALPCLWVIFWAKSALVLLWSSFLVGMLASEAWGFVTRVTLLWFLLILALPPVASLLVLLVGLKCASPVHPK